MFTDKRTARRFLTRMSIVSSDKEGLNFSFLADLSREGAYIETEKLLAVGSPFTFVMGNRLIQSPVNTRVVRVRDAFFEGGRSGIGVRFEKLDSVAKTLRDDMLLYLMSEPYHVCWYTQPHP